MAGRKGGRRRKEGERYACGKLRPVRDTGNDRVSAHREFYLREGQIRPADDLDCAIGQAHAAGLLEDMRVEGRVLMEYGREYHRLYRGIYGGQVRTSNFERLDRSAPDLAITATDFRFRNWSAIVARLSPGERHCLNLVCVEFGEGWDLPPFLERFVNQWKSRRQPGRHSGLRLPEPGDAAMLEYLRSALLALAEGAGARNRGRSSPQRPG